jgi:hypothetical protein
MADRHTLTRDRLRETRLQRGVAGRGLEFEKKIEVELHSASRGDGLTPGAQRFHGSDTRRVFAGTHVDGKCHVLRNHVHRTRPRFQLAHGAHETGARLAMFLDRKHHFRRSGECILARAHRHRPSMPR